MGAPQTSASNEEFPITLLDTELDLILLEKAISPLYLAQTSTRFRMRSITLGEWVHVVLIMRESDLTSRFRPPPHRPRYRPVAVIGP